MIEPIQTRSAPGGQPVVASSAVDGATLKHIKALLASRAPAIHFRPTAYPLAPGRHLPDTFNLLLMRLP